jgi:Tfp pilus assembly protein PilP
MKLTTGILALGMAVATAWGQNPDVIQNTRDTLKAVEKKKASDSNTAAAASQGQEAKSPAVSSKAAANPASSKPGSSGTASAPSASQGQGAGKTAGPQKAAPLAHTTAAPKVATKQAAPKAKAVAMRKPWQPKQRIAVEDKKKATVAKNETPKVINLTGRRDPFISPVVNRSMVGSGCSTGKRCLTIDQINLKGVVKADAGMIAVVVNTMNKAYFLRENDPVFNGYVVKITGDSIVFKETVQDRLGKPFTREVTKKITTPAV